MVKQGIVADTVRSRVPNVFAHGLCIYHQICSRFRWLLRTDCGKTFGTLRSTVLYQTRLFLPCPCARAATRSICSPGRPADQPIDRNLPNFTGLRNDRLDRLLSRTITSTKDFALLVNIPLIVRHRSCRERRRLSFLLALTL